MNLILNTILILTIFLTGCDNIRSSADSDKDSDSSKSNTVISEVSKGGVTFQVESVVQNYDNENNPYYSFKIKNTGSEPAQEITCKIQFFDNGVKEPLEEQVINIANFNKNSNNLDPSVSNSDGVQVLIKFNKISSHDQYDEVKLIVDEKQHYTHNISINANN
ncbi:hypothetical protein DID75_04190 [Candidatus Marinamargulisbacteria bacterium SCGC AG-410-N11]|nr:hypothetical protein DID75_04190 [Candidatus Marinamargulisbacteria bacterium SCGC AG-410-N11]